jgi:hypothetical protein
MIHHFGVLGFDKMNTTIGNRDETLTDSIKIQKLYPIINNNKKIFTIDSSRPIDFGLDSYFQYITP